MTGVISLANELYGKQLGILHELMPSALHFGVLYNPRSPLRAVIAEDTGSAASALGLSVELLDASTGADIDAVFARIGDERHVQGLLVSLDLAFLHWHKQTIWRMWPTAVLNDPFTLDILETERKSWSGIRKSLRAAAKDQRTLQGMANAQSAKLLARVVRLEKKIAAASDMEAIKLIEDKISALLRVLNEHVLPLVQVLTQGPNAEQAFDRAHAPESMEKIVRLEAALDARIGKVLARLVGLKEFKRTPAAGAAAIELNQHSELLTDRR